MADPRILLEGIALGECPRWHENRLWFSDWGTRQIVAVDRDGESEVMQRAEAMPFSFDWAPDGRLLTISGRDALLQRQESDSSQTTVADLRHLAATPWNEIVVDSRGNTYLNNIGFDFGTGGEPRPGIVALVTSDGLARQVADGLMFPNGMVVTPDNATLILAESYANALAAFDIAANGDLINRRVWARLDGAAPDGICLDGEGAIWYADVPNQCCVRVREGGEVLQKVTVDRGCFACMLGGPDGTTLYIMAAKFPDAMQGGAPTGQLLAFETPAPRAGWP